MSYPEMLGWSVVEHRDGISVWRDLDGDFLGLVRTQDVLALPKLGDRDAVSRHCRAIAESVDAKLIEAAVVEHVNGGAVWLIHKRLERPTWVYTGILIVPGAAASWVWTVAAHGRASPSRSDPGSRRLLPGHLLSKVRRELERLLMVRLEPSTTPEVERL